MPTFTSTTTRMKKPKIQHLFIALFILSLLSFVVTDFLASTDVELQQVEINLDPQEASENSFRYLTFVLQKVIGVAKSQGIERFL